MKKPDRQAEPAAWRELLKVLKLRPAEAAAILGVPERAVAMWMAGQALHPGGPGGQFEAARRLIDAVQARRGVGESAVLPSGRVDPKTATPEGPARAPEGREAASAG